MRIITTPTMAVPNINAAYLIFCPKYDRPAPISPVSAARGANVVVDLDDPAVLKRLGTSGWIEAKRRQAEAEWKKMHG